MRKYLKESLHWLHLALFKPISVQAEALRLSRSQELVLLKVLPLQIVMIVGVVAIVGWARELAGYPFAWSKGLVGAMVFALVGGLVGWLFAGPHHWLGGGLGGGLGCGLVGALSVGLGRGLGDWMVIGAALGSVIGMVLGLWDSEETSTGRGVGVAMVGLLFFGLLGALGVGVFVGLGIGFDKALRQAVLFFTGFAAVFLFVYFRPFHLVPHVFQLWRSRRTADPFEPFRNSPVYWDEAMAMPLLFLTNWLVRLARFDRARGMSEIARAGRLPHQRRAAQQALINVLIRDLEQADSFDRMASAETLLEILPSNAEYLPAGLTDAARHISRVAELASDYLTRVTPAGQMNVLEGLRGVIESFRNAMILVESPVGPAFQSAASRWLEIVKVEEAQCRKRSTFEPIPNPFLVGNPLKIRDHDLFKGRRDVVVVIEENIINPAQRPALLLYGRRRIGKTSTLLNLSRLLSSTFVPVFIDCQDAKWREGDEVFCYHLAASIYDALNQRSLVETGRRPQLERFHRYAFTRLGEYLDEIEETSETAHKQILLTFDEYEKLEDGISASKLSIEVLNQLRTIVQHRERIVVLFSGGHRFEEMRTINWSDYLINVKTLELSFLAPEDARELITEPVPLLQYESGVIEQIIELTHCQPYLLQAVASDMVNYLNSEKRMLATAADLEVAVEKVLVTVQSYFFYTWTGDCGEPEREVLRLIATGDTNGLSLAAHQSSLQGLCHKEILERHASHYRFSIELFRRWVLKNQTTQAFPPGDLPEPAELEYADLQTTHT